MKTIPNVKPNLITPSKIGPNTNDLLTHGLQTYSAKHCTVTLPAQLNAWPPFVSEFHMETNIHVNTPTTMMSEIPEPCHPPAAQTRLAQWPWSWSSHRSKICRPPPTSSPSPLCSTFLWLAIRLTHPYNTTHFCSIGDKHQEPRRLFMQGKGSRLNVYLIRLESFRPI